MNSDVDARRLALLRDLYDAFNRRDVEAVLEAMTEDVDWPNVRAGTRLHGRDAVREYWQRQFEEIDPSVEPTGFIVDGDDVVVSVHQVVRNLAGSVLSEADIAHTYTFRGDLAAAMYVTQSPPHGSVPSPGSGGG